jgi:ABC-type sugar transport system substrate-binding protein
MRRVAFALAVAAGMSCGGDSSRGAVRVGYVLHGMNSFTEVIKRGAEQAGRALGVEVEVAGPPSFTAKDAIDLFEGMVQKRKTGIVVVPQPGEVWVVPIRQATQAGIPVLTANVTSPGSTASAWFGQDEYKSGVVLAGELRKILEAAGQKEGKLVVGMCAPGVAVLTDRYNGFLKGMEGARYAVTKPFDVTAENTSNYSAWENLASANKDMIAAVGLCSHDISNLAKLKTRIGAKWMIAGYDLNLETLEAVKAGVAQVTVGQHPYLQGYLPVLAMVQHKRDGKPPVRGWIDVGTEVVTKANVEELYRREADRAEETRWYADHMARNFGDLGALARPLPGAR